MSRPPTMSQLLKRAGLGKRVRHPGVNAMLSDSTDVPEPAGKKRRGSRQDRKSGTNESSRDRVLSDAVDDQIAALERELADDTDSSSESDACVSAVSDDSGDDDGDDAPVDRHAAAQKHSQKIVSSLEAEKIEPLPTHLLPRPGCGFPKDGKHTKRARTRSAPQSGPSQGLKEAVRELLENYEARSSERVPFYCRVCKFQGDSLEDLERHKLEPLHEEATRKERKISSCSLCKKQFTSPPQLKEHLAGKSHRDKLQVMISRQGKLAPGQMAHSGSSAASDGSSHELSGGDKRRNARSRQRR